MTTENLTFEGKYAQIPVYMRESLSRYVSYGSQAHQVGGFLHALLINDLVGAFSKADDNNGPLIGLWVKYLYNYVPADCWGSPEAVEQWRGLHAPKPAE